MAGPFYNAIKGTTAGAPGTGAFTPNAASTGFRAWSTVPTGWIGLVRYEDGSDWELSYSYWNGTTLSRGTNQRSDSSTGSALSLTSSATAAMIVDANDMAPDIGGCHTTYISSSSGATAPSLVGVSAVTANGTGSSPAVASTNYLTEQARILYTSATTANALGGMTFSAANGLLPSSSTAGRGGWEFRSRFGASGLPTAPRVMVGGTSTTLTTGEPSALVANVAALAKDSTDTNLQLLVNNNSGTGTKTDTGIPLVANGWYEVTLWALPGSLTIYLLLIRRDTGDIYYGSTATDVPVSGTVMLPIHVGGLSATAGTAILWQIGHIAIRTGS